MTEIRGRQGEQGKQGERGKQGEAGMPAATRRAVLFLVLLTLFASGINLFWTAHLVNQANHSKCGTVLTLAHIPIPAQDITPGARRFDTDLTQAFAARARQLGCG